MSLDIRVITAPDWGARPPKSASAPTTPQYVVIHHTATPIVSEGTSTGAKTLARQIQDYHMDKLGWVDSGHNFLNTSGGFLLEGRHGSWEAAQQGRSVKSAHAGSPIGNESPGIENEGNFTTSSMSQAQWTELVSLCTYLCRVCRVDPNRIVGHRDFVATECPGQWLYAQLPRLRQEVRAKLKEVVEPPKPNPKPIPDPGPTPAPLPVPLPVPVPAPGPSGTRCYSRYNVRPGDSPRQIAKQFLGNAERWQEILSSSGVRLNDSTRLQPGDLLYLPADTYRAYMLAAGDTLRGIAKRELGDAERWQELRSTEGDPFSEAQAARLGVGTLLCLPSTAPPVPPTPVPIPVPVPIPAPTPAPPLDAQGLALLAQVPLSLQSYAKQSLPYILAALTQYQVTNANHIAYVVATAEHESNLGRWLEELADGSQYENRPDLGNSQAGDGSRFKGRGYVQITGRLNYQKYTQILGVDLVKDPSLATRPDFAAAILVHGMFTGGFTAYKLVDFDQPGGAYDFINARRIVNGLDRAEDIAQRALVYRRALAGGAPIDPNVPPGSKTVYRLLVPRYDPRTLSQARKLAADAFERSFNGQPYIQVASFFDPQLAEQKRGQWLADNFPGAVLETATIRA